MTTVDIELAAAGDLPAILAISNWAAMHTPANFATEPESIDDWLSSWEGTHAMYPWLVARRRGPDGSDVLGFAKASPHRARGAYAWTAEVSVYVHPDHHGRGVGRSLYRELISLLERQGYVTLLAGITAPNPASEALHRSFGFRKVGSLERVGWKFNRWHDVGWWELFLRPADQPPGTIRPVLEIRS